MRVAISNNFFFYLTMYNIQYKSIYIVSLRDRMIGLCISLKMCGYLLKSYYRFNIVRDYHI